MHTDNFRLGNVKQLIECIKNNDTQILIICQFVINHIITELLKSSPIRNLGRYNSVDCIMTIFLANIEGNISLITSQFLAYLFNYSRLTNTRLTNQANVISQRINTNLSFLSKLSCHIILPPIKTDHRLLRYHRQTSSHPHRTEDHRHWTQYS